MEPSAYQPQPLPRPGDIVADRYLVESVLGMGGMGVVVAARHVHLDQRVAIKFLLPQVASNPQAVARLIREARAAVSLTSPHVAKVTDVGTLANGSPYMVMELLAGRDLSSVIEQRGRLSVPETADILVQACDAIAEAHARGIVHRDLKPSNLFLTQTADGAMLVKVLDFGISKAVGAEGSSNSLTMTGMMLGSPNYMSPEQVRSTKNVDARADIWALGVVMYECLAGDVPFRGETLGDTLLRIATDPTPSLQSLGIPADVASIVEDCLQKDAARRIPTVAELVRRLSPYATQQSAQAASASLKASGVVWAAPPRQAATGTNTSLTPMSSLPARTKSTRSSRLVFGLGAMVLCALGVVVVVVALTRHAQEPAIPATAPLRESEALSASALPPGPSLVVSAVPAPEPSGSGSTVPSASGAPTPPTLSSSKAAPRAVPRPAAPRAAGTSRARSGPQDSLDLDQRH